MILTVDADKLCGVNDQGPSTVLMYAYMLGASVDNDVRIHYDDVRRVTGLSNVTISASIRNLISKGVVDRIGKGLYLLMDPNSPKTR